ncbi:MFS transporter [Alkalihalobacillus alcalophilus ATCC 27647 = CGMCC 1.3604]|uniref:MFS transporter n=1 Tax=Alkalihalobacillus alcalophilus ATCC 27647 = CGMCC 1.3604 TaxID=1218173 RepID=J8Q663_ALKAL|nr:MFS transporter [Alkalihalobacillus alcalophilus]AFV25899.1 unknown transporter [Alkalihalobacillus alcalophilus ATCC 27647 = CGMCC 1.3604]KGA98508.1 MFS transporter [Alkalihalobacillus alcalophilus ATCC 27647 = CGMCC 1.3604]MED1563724.1 MFS transporter [Alkalihalobacillus alcalophilus]THG91029.1 MFS transporter [Alkalihalobacillus alcalophilus ATCC 27647 = CGMCC 1.3604]
MTLLLLVIIYLAFISLGLPDPLLGAAWPVMQQELGLPLEAAGFLFMTIAGGTIVSSLVSGRIIMRFGTGKVTFFSGLMTASALLGFYFAPSIMWLVAWSILLGLGAGAVDAALNNYVANNYKAHHMSWLHSFWGVGATLGPLIMAQFISGQHAWRSGYLTISVIQFTLAAILLFSLPLWNRISKNSNIALNENSEPIHAETSCEDIKPIKPLQIKGVKLSMFAFLFYCGVEATVGLWGSSFLVNVKELPASVAAQWVSFYWGGLTIGRFLTGFVTFKMSNRMLIRTGQLIALIGAILLVLPLPAIVSLVGFIMVGFGLAPIFPCMLHETPARFGKTHSQTIMGYQMAVAYTGSAFMPPLLGFLASNTTIGIFPFFIVVYIVVMLLCSEQLNAVLRRRAVVSN